MHAAEWLEVLALHLQRQQVRHRLSGRQAMRYGEQQLLRERIVRSEAAWLSLRQGH